MKPSDAAKIIGCDESHVRRLIRDGKMDATYIEINGRKFYDVSLEEAEYIRDNIPARGRERGPIKK